MTGMLPSSGNDPKPGKAGQAKNRGRRRLMSWRSQPPQNSSQRIGAHMITGACLQNQPGGEGVYSCRASYTLPTIFSLGLSVLEPCFHLAGQASAG